MPSRPGTRLLTSAALLLTSFGALSTTSLAAASSSVAASDQGGPHSPLGRRTAPTTVSHTSGVAISHYDFGDAEIGVRPGQFRAPVRGSLITPDAGSTPSKFVIISHLRSPGCAHRVYAFPCPDQDVRLDRGMEYLGVALAKQGYTVLVPDLAPVWIGGTLRSPYDQYGAWLKVVGQARDRLARDVAGTGRDFGLDLHQRVDMSGVALIVHSRSGYVAGPVAQAWASGPTPVRAVLAYGPAYDVPDGDGRISPPVPGDVPFLGLVGDADQDVPFNVNMWLSENVGQQRIAPAVVVTVPGLGHDAINETLSNAHVDDRLDCTPATCPTPQAHRAFLTSVAEQYLGATLRHQPTDLPLTADAVLPRQLDGYPTRVLAVTNAADRITVFDADTSGTPRVTPGSSANLCRFYPPDDLNPHPARCADPNLGTDMLVSRVARVRLAPGGSVMFPTHVSQATSVDVQLTPYADRADGKADSPVQVTVTTSTGRRVALAMPADTGDVTRNRSTTETNGIYVLGTIRIPVPASLRSSTITSVEVTAPQGGEYALRAVDVCGRAVGAAPSTPAAPSGGSDTSTKPSPSTTTPSHGSSAGRPGSSIVTGPLVQTDRVGTGQVETGLGGGTGAVGLVVGGAVVLERRRRLDGGR